MQNMFIFKCDTNMAFKHISLLWNANGVIMVHVGDTAFFPGQKPISPGHVGDTAILPGQKTISPHSEHSAVLPLTPHTIPNRKTCQKEKCIINRL